MPRKKIDVIRGNLTAEEVRAEKREKRRLGLDKPPPGDFTLTVKEPPPDDAEALCLVIAENGQQGWRASGVLAPEDDHIVIRTLSVEAIGAAKSGGVTRTIAKAIPVAAILTRALHEVRRRAWYVDRRRAIGAPLPIDAVSIERAAGLIGAGSKSRAGRKPYPDEHYAQVAADYLDLLGQGVTRGILDAIGKRWEKRLGRKVARETVRDWVHRATELEFLRARRPGKAYAEPGPRLLQQSNKEET